MSTGWLHEALIEMSGTPRCAPTMAASSCWNTGRPKMTDLPPPLADGYPGTFHTLARAFRRPSLSRRRLRPPTALTSGSLAGHDLTGRGSIVGMLVRESAAAAAPHELSA